MRNLFKYFLLLILIVNIFAQTPGKRESQYGFEVYYRPPIYYDFFSELPDQNNKIRINFLLKIQNDLFRFTNIDNQYTAQYEVTVAIKKAENKSAMFSETWRKTVQVNSFEETNSKTLYNIEQDVFDVVLEPGEYRLFLEVIDSDTEKGYRNSRLFVIEKNVNHTNIKIMAPENNISDEIVLGPEPPVVEFNEDKKASFIFATPIRDSIHVSSKLQRIKEDDSPVIRENSFRLMARDDLTTIEETIKRKFLEEGSYLLEYTIDYNQGVTTVKKYFSVVWFDKPDYLYKHDLALRPMMYMLTPEEFDNADGLSYDELGEWMEEFWMAKDPTPDTPLNEIMLEYFSRVTEANKRYSERFSEGWETDRGKALILYGPPTRVESNRYAINKKPYEIWFYEKLNKKLIFMDKNKEENYTLISVEDIEENKNE